MFCMMNLLVHEYGMLTIYLGLWNWHLNSWGSTSLEWIIT